MRRKEGRGGRGEGCLPYVQCLPRKLQPSLSLGHQHSERKLSVLCETQKKKN